MCHEFDKESLLHNRVLTKEKEGFTQYKKKQLIRTDGTGKVAAYLDYLVLELK